jgi:Plasmid pRiA4b ORF-3-like protein
MRTKHKSKSVAPLEHVCQFLIVLPKTDPLVWRRIQVPNDYTFWDLHVAIQDAMGWKDYHLHEFVLVDSKSRRVVRIGIPDDEMPDERPCLAGWKVPIARFLTYGVDPVRYRYDFGDDWEHTLEFEEVVQADDGGYPRCVAGAGACPPEDVGGIHGFAEFLRVIRDSRHPEHDSMLQWAGGRFDAEAFNPRSITFDNPRDRWKMAFEPRGSAV